MVSAESQLHAGKGVECAISTDSVSGTQGIGEVDLFYGCKLTDRSTVLSSRPKKVPTSTFPNKVLSQKAGVEHVEHLNHRIVGFGRDQPLPVSDHAYKVLCKLVTHIGKHCTGFLQPPLEGSDSESDQEPSSAQHTSRSFGKGHKSSPLAFICSPAAEVVLRFPISP